MGKPPAKKDAKNATPAAPVLEEAAKPAVETAPAPAPVAAAAEPEPITLTDTPAPAPAAVVATPPAAAAVDPLEGMPQELLDALADADMLEASQNFTNDHRVSIQLRRIEIVQKNAKNHPPQIRGRMTAGQLAIVDREGNAIYRPTMNILLVDQLYYTPQTIPAELKDHPAIAKVFRRDRDIIGARMMWRYNEATGQREVKEGEAPVCSSANGLTPWGRNLGQEIIDPRFALPQGMPPVKHKIGYDDDPISHDPKQVSNPCLTCVFAEWLEKNEAIDDKSRKPMCQVTPTFIVWSVEDKELMILKATNATLVAAMLGAKPKSFGSKADGSGLPGIMSYFAENGYYNPETGEKLTLQEMAYKIKSLPDLAARQAFYARYIKTFANRPQGQPSKARPYVPVHPVMLSVTQAAPNGYGTQPMIPQFTHLDGSVTEMDGAFNSPDNPDYFPVESYTLSPVELGEYLQAVREYTLEGYRDSLMGVQQNQSNIMPQLNGANVNGTAALPAGTPAAPPADIDVNSPFN